jgi:hypothetical protein
LVFVEVGKVGKVRKIEKKILPDSYYLPHLPYLHQQLLTPPPKSP